MYRAENALNATLLFGMLFATLVDIYPFVKNALKASNYPILVFNAKKNLHIKQYYSHADIYLDIYFF